MKITRRQLRRIIQEELRRTVLSEHVRHSRRDCREHAKEHMDEVDTALNPERGPVDWRKVDTAWKAASELMDGHTTPPWDGVAQSDDEKLTMARTELGFWRRDLRNMDIPINCEQG